MTQFMQKSFSNYANVIHKDVCKICHKEATIFNITVEGKICNGCYTKIKEKRNKEAKSS